MVFKNTEDIFFFIKKRCNTFFILPYIWLQINGRFIKDGHGGGGGVKHPVVHATYFL